jgi:hypothetical protein
MAVYPASTMMMKRIRRHWDLNITPLLSCLETLSIKREKLVFLNEAAPIGYAPMSHAR